MKKCIILLISKALFFLLFCGITFCLAQSSPQSVKNSTGENTAFQFGIRATGTYNYPFDSLGSLWSPFVTGGIQLDFPTYIPHLFFSGIFDGGLIEKKDKSVTDLKIFHQTIAAVYHISLVKRFFGIRPQVGLVNTMIYIGEVASTIINDAVFDAVENEFGILVGADIVFSYKKLLVSIPVSVTRTFSSPKYFDTATLSFTVGACF